MTQDDQLLNFIESYVAENGWAPTVREMGVHLGVTSSPTVQQRIVRLEKEGRVVAKRRLNRTLKLEVVW